ncbi:unnamed protein product [Rotaria socialis]|uniref:Uncharacterized protein n=1 Tax=Rotaria socialis TaxID=392032 RepID=A0A818F961_9BILA|nr:unnamed protein product [Rotaria socialis]CAF3471300.1 unnamed protein product [Rotaria socialis]CAF3728469.1 unnamed protein product [Rotaria socialis]CAF4212690.1 unnamed protein product [Rotaria socialis]CAF4385094.1 unnamed protein product [Rotaria socialis]
MSLMETSSLHSFETNQSSIQGYSTPPRSNIPPSTNRSFSELFHHSKILTSNELKRRFSPMKKRRHHRIRKNDSIVPLKRNLNMPVILEKLFDYKEDHVSSKSINDNDCLVPLSSANCSLISSKIIHPQPIYDCSIANSCKIKQEKLFSISETTMKQKFQTLFQKN